jgi:gluconolactonase
MERTLIFVLIVAVAAIALKVSLAGAQAETPKTTGKIERLDPALDELIQQDAKIEVISTGHEWSEGPVWIEKGKYLLFSDIPRNHILKWKRGEGVSVFMEPSGYTGPEDFTGREPGTNGLTLDAKGRLVICCHGDRQVKRVEEDGTKTILASRYEGKRLNSPNDLIYHSNGDLYFTDPPYGLPKGFEDPARELDWCGVYRLSKDGTLTLLTKEMTRPNGIGLSPDEKTLYVGQSDSEAPIWKGFEMLEDGTLGKSRLLFDGAEQLKKRRGVPDGMAVDERGNVWATGPGGVLVLTPQGKLLGRIALDNLTANCAFGEDGKTLFITSDMIVCRVRTLVKGLGY